jgi:DNA-binding LytR/AlgR family response regulator
MKINCIIIDDEPLARKGLQEYIRDTEFLECSGEFETPVKATDILATGKIQLVFLDIQMPKISGIEFLRTLQQPPHIIFTTAYPQYAVEGFELNADDYLLKPFSFERFLKAVMKVRATITGQASTDSRPEPVGADHFFFKTDNRLTRIRFDEILFVEALQNYVAIHTPSKKHISYLTFKAVEESLPPQQFIKVHKSYLINVEKIDSIAGNEIFIGAHRIPLSRNLKEEVMEKLLKGKFLKR